MRLHRRARRVAPATAAAIASAALLVPLGARAASTASVNIADSPPDSACGGNPHCFDPATVHVDPGGTVTWTSSSGVPHTVSADDGSWSSGDLAATQSFSHTFASAGTFTYHCNVHPSYMHGTVVVGSGAPPSTQPPPTKAPPSHAPTAAPTVRAAATQAPTAAQATPQPTAAPSSAPLAQAQPGSAGAATPEPSPSDAAPTGVAATTPAGGGGRGAGPVLAVVAAFIVLAGAGTWWARRRRSIFTKIH